MRGGIDVGLMIRCKVERFCDRVSQNISWPDLHVAAKVYATGIVEMQSFY